MTTGTDTDADASDVIAEVRCPYCGWIGMEPSDERLCPDCGYGLVTWRLLRDPDP